MEVSAQGLANKAAACMAERLTACVSWPDAPLQVPQEFMDKFPESMFYDKRRMLAMSAFWDE